MAAKRPSGEREGWAFHHVVRTTLGWAMVDEILFTFPGHTEENPRYHVQSLQEAISEAYHATGSDSRQQTTGSRRTRMLASS